MDKKKGFQWRAPGPQQQGSGLGGTTYNVHMYNPQGTVNIGSNIVQPSPSYGHEPDLEQDSSLSVDSERPEIIQEPIPEASNMQDQKPDVRPKHPTELYNFKKFAENHPQDDDSARMKTGENFEGKQKHQLDSQGQKNGEAEHTNKQSSNRSMCCIHDPSWTPTNSNGQGHTNTDSQPVYACLRAEDHTIPDNTDLGLKMKDLTLKENQQKEKPGPLLGCRQIFGHPIDLRQCFGDVTRFLPVVGKAVCFLTWQSYTKAGTGTGFVFGSLPNNNKRCFIILTCYHLLELGLGNAMSEPYGTKCATFHLYKDASSVPEVINVDILRVIVYNKKMDYAMLCLEVSDDLCQIFTNENVIGQFIHNMEDAPKHLSTLTLVGYPGSQRKMVDSSVVIYSKDHIEREGKLSFPITADDAKMLFYNCSSLEGASGSPGFDLGTKTLYIMHQGGTSTHPAGNSIYEHGVLLYHVVCDIKTKILSMKCSTLTMAEFYILFPTFKPQQQFQPMLFGQTWSQNPGGQFS